MLQTLFYVWCISHAKKVNVTVEWIWQPVFWQFIQLHFGTRDSPCTACSSHLAFTHSLSHNLRQYKFHCSFTNSNARIPPDHLSLPSSTRWSKKPQWFRTWILKFDLNSRTWVWIPAPPLTVCALLGTLPNLRVSQPVRQYLPRGVVKSMQWVNACRTLWRVTRTVNST